jgi:tryptophan 2,3-dioxygenase
MGVMASTTTLSAAADSGRADGLTYAGYLNLDELLGLQVPVASAPPVEDELAFIIVHQVYELWFKLLLVELRTARDAMYDGAVERARASFARVHSVCHVMIEQFAILESLPLVAFDNLREQLGRASGFESVQFRELEALAQGRRSTAYGPSGDEPSLWAAFCTALERAGLPMPGDDAEVRTESLLRVVREPERHGALPALMRAMVDYDTAFSLWRARHVLLVQRCIGQKRGTGGTSGGPYLSRTLEKRFFPELWELPTFV